MIRHARLEADGLGRWRVDGEAASRLDGCLDIDLESSAMTNAMPVHRMDLPIGARASAPLPTCGPLDLSAGRLDQDYLRTADEGRHQRYDYAAPVFDFACRLIYDESGLVLDYPGIAVRALLTPADGPPPPCRRCAWRTQITSSRPRHGRPYW